MLFADILMRRDIATVPLGIGRVHRIECLEDEIPGQEDRLREILEAVKKGATTAHRINSFLSFRSPRPVLLADCETLAARGQVIARRNSRTPTRYFPVPE